MVSESWFFIFVASIFVVGAIHVAWKRSHMPTWRAGTIMLLGCALLIFARAMQSENSDLVSRLFWYKLFLLGFLVIPTSFFVLTMRYAGLGYTFTPRMKVLISIFPLVMGGLILTNEFHGWVWDPKVKNEFVNSLSSLPSEASRLGYWLFVGHSYLMMGIGCYLLYRVRTRSMEASKWKTNLIIIGSVMATFGPLVDIFHISPFPPFVASLLGILIGATLLFFNISPLRKRDLLYITRGAIIQNMSDPILVVDKDNSIIDVNPATEALINKPASQLMGKPLGASFPELQLTWDDHMPQRGEIALEGANSTLILDYRISAIKDWQDQVISQLIVLRDITERKQAEAELQARRETEQHFSNQLTALARVTQTLSKANTLDQLCRQAVEMGRNTLGYDRLSIWFVTEDLKWMMGTFGTSIEGEITDEREARHAIATTAHVYSVLIGNEEIQAYENAPLYRADGQQVGMGVRVTAGLWDGETVIGFLSVDNHICHIPFTEHDKEIIRLYASALGHLSTLKRFQEALYHLTNTLEHRVADRTQELETANKELEAFAYSISHDLRAPIRAVDGYITLLMEDYGTNLNSEGRRISNIIQKEARRMGRLIDDLLAFSRYSRTEMRRTVVDIEALVTALAEDLVPPAQTPRIEIVIEKLSPAWGDYGLLQQVWTNLISNAIKFTSKCEKALIHIQCEEDNEKVTYLIRDNGVGFDMAYAHKLFGVFQRLHSESEFPGTGAGLAIVQRIITRHGGKIWAESEEGVGTTFFFTLPRGV